MRRATAVLAAALAASPGGLADLAPVQEPLLADPSEHPPSVGAALPAVPWQPGPKRFSVEVPGFAGGPTISLYPAGGAVHAATGPSLAASLASPAQGNRWTFVELYDHMCPHCWYAVPIITAVANAFDGAEGWNIESLNCHEGVNTDACFFLELISGARDYPTFLLCPPAHAATEEALIRDLQPRARALMERLQGPMLVTFKRLMRCTRRFQEPRTARGEEDPFLSAKVVAQWITGETGIVPQHPSELEGGADFTETDAPDDPGAPPGRPGWLRDEKEGAPGVPAWVPGQRWFDAMRGFVHLLYMGYRADRHDDAIHAAMFLARTFPVKGPALAQLAEELRSRGPQEEPADFRAHLVRWAREMWLPDPSDPDDNMGNDGYMTCDGSSCAMWTLLHVTIASAAARGISGRPLLGDDSILKKADKEEFPTVEQCMGFVRRFVSAFLNCRQCKQNFLEDFDSCEFGRCGVKDYRGLALWLWRKHNAVSMRVALRHHAQVDRRWPMFEDCPACWRRDLVLGRANRRLRPLAWNQEELDAPYNTEHVFWHIVRTYVGLTRVRIEMEDLSPDEEKQVQAVLEHDRRQEARVARTRPESHRTFVEHPPAPYIPHGSVLHAKSGTGEASPGSALVVVVIALCVFLVFGAVVYLNGFFDPESLAGMRSSRAPVLRHHEEQSVARAADPYDDDGAPEGEHLKDVPGHDEDPAAE